MLSVDFCVAIHPLYEHSIGHTYEKKNARLSAQSRDNYSWTLERNDSKEQFIEKLYGRAYLEKGKKLSVNWGH